MRDINNKQPINQESHYLLVLTKWIFYCFFLVISLLQSHVLAAVSTHKCVQGYQGGTELCEEAKPILSPWEFRACSETRPTVREWASWCEASGGVPSGGTHNFECSGGTGLYSSESQMKGVSSAFSSIYTNACSGPTLASDSGWGSTQSHSCWSVGHSFVNGMVVNAGKKLVYAGESEGNDGACSNSWTMPIIGWKKREFSCPQNTAAIWSGANTNRTLKCVYEPAYTLTPSIQNDCQVKGDNEGNPCNPATGNKSQIEQDYLASGTLSFNRFYNSLPFNSDKHFAKNWSHTYSSKMDSVQKIAPLRTKYATSYQSDSHATPDDACLIGFSEIKDTVWGGSLSTAIPEYMGGNLCKISVNGNIVTWFSISSKSYIEPEPLPQNIHTLVRPNGTRYVFEQINGSWSSTLNPDLKLEQRGTNWEFTNTNSTKETYNELGQLINITSLSGRSTRLHYDIAVIDGGDGNSSTLDQVIDYTGRRLLFNYIDLGEQQRLSTVTTPDGDIQYEYSATGNLINVIYPDTSSKTYHYEDNQNLSHLTGITDENNKRYATWTYNSVGKVTSSEHANGTEKVTFGYNLYHQHNTTVVGALLDRRTYQFEIEKGTRRVKEISGDECLTCPNGFMKTRSYDDNGFLNGYTDWQGNQTTIVNNARGLPIQQTEAVGTPQERTSTTTWHSSLSLPLTVTEPKRQTTFSYTTTGQLLSRTVTDTNTNISRTISYTYHPLGTNGGGLIATIDGPRTDVNDITSYDYNDSDDLINITNALGHTTQITSHDPSGRPLTIIDANNTTTTLTWDLRGRLTSSSVTGNTTTFSYDPVGQLTRVTNPNNSYLEYRYDDAQRLIEISNNLNHKISYTLDNMGNRTQTQTEDANGTITLNQSAVFDKLSRLKESLGANAQKQSYNYDSNHNPLSSTDALNRQSQNNYDALDRLIKSIDPDTKETNFEYDNQDNLTKVTDARGLETTYTYNGFDEVISQTSPDTGTSTYTYDSAGNITSMTDARGITVTYTYDALNRLLAENYPDTTEKVLYRHDIGTRRNGRVYDIRDDSGRNIFSYDTRGNNTYQRHDIDGYQFTTRYYYWKENRLRVLTYPSGRQVLYTRDASGRTNRVRTREKINGTWTAWTNVASNIRHQPFGDINAMTYGNGLSYTADFDLDARLTQQTINAVFNKNYSYTTVNTLLTIEDVLNNQFSQYFEYDTLDRLNYEEGQYGSRYFEYDAVGNRTYQENNTGSPITSTYNSDANQLLRLNSQNDYSYDEIGNTLTDRNNRRRFTYNDKGRLESLYYNDVLIANYHYNAQGQRVKKSRTLSNGTILNYYFQYNKQGQLLSEVYYIGTRLYSYTDFVWLEGRPLAQIKSIFYSNGNHARTETRYLHTDHLNTPRKATNENGTVVWEWNSDAFGHVQPNRDPDSDGKKEYMRLRFAGQYHDAESGLFYNYYRYYDPYTGRYVTSDPIGLAGGINTYGYVGGNPTGYTDSLGLAVDQLKDGDGHYIDFDGANAQTHDALINNAYSQVGPAILEHGWMHPAILVGTAGYGSIGTLGLKGLYTGLKGCFVKGSTKGLIDARKIRFTQDSIKGTFKDGRSLKGLIDDLKAGRVTADDLPPIRTFTRNGQTLSLDNRRLFAFQQAGKKIKTVPASAKEISKEAFKFTSKNGGTSIRVRGGL